VKSRYVIGEEGIMTSLLDEFPHLYTTPQTMHYLWQRHSKQIDMLTKNYNEFKKRYIKQRSGKSGSDDQLDRGKYNKFLEDAFRKQKMLMEIMRDDLAHYERLNELKRHQTMGNSVKVWTQIKNFSR